MQQRILKRLGSKWLIIGGSGMLGEAIVNALKSSGRVCYTAARRSADYKLNLIEKQNIENLIAQIKPDFVINCAGITDLAFCEQSSPFADKVNGEAVGAISKATREVGAKFTHISTDAFYNQKENLNTEDNQRLFIRTAYAKSKYIGEISCGPTDLIVRTSFLGRKKNGQSLLDFYINSILNKQRINVYNDAMTSSLDVPSCAALVVELIERDAIGLFNLGTSHCYAKSDVFLYLLKLSGRTIPFELTGAKNVKEYSSNLLQGMNVTKVEQFLEKKMPKLENVIDNLMKTGRLNELL